jgi:CBS domain-containing protein
MVALDGSSFLVLADASQSIHRFFEKSSRRFAQRADLGRRMACLPLELFDTKAGDLMHSPVTTLRKGMPLREALAVALEKHFTSYPVLDGDGKVLGIVEHDDLAYQAQNPDSAATLDSLPLLPCPTVLADTPVPTVLERFARSGSTRLLVTDHDGRLQGILTQLDMAAARVRLDEPDQNGT